jgi:uncharacterized membrane protein YjfL (UPF0719 family)
MSGDEIFALIGSIVLGIVGWKNWLGGLFLLSSLSRKPATQFLGWLAPLVGGLALFFVLCKWSSHDVRDNPIYIFFYMAMGFGWAGLWNWILPYVGLSFRDDALERDNDAAGLAVSGSLLGTTFTFAGANIGDGPGWWVVVFCAALAGVTMILLWMIGSQITRVQEFITVDRDIAAGWRVAGFFIGSGLILGRAVAGDWHSAQATVSDFLAKGWPVLILWGIALLLDMTSKPTPQRPAPNSFLFGVIPAVLLVGISIADIFLQGPW